MIKTYFEQVFAIFFTLCIAFIPLNFNGKGFQFQITHFLFQDLIQTYQSNFFEYAFKSIDFSSDTIAFNLLILLLFFISIMIVIILEIFKFRNLDLIVITRTIVIFYLSYILLKYGFDKIFKVQFYLPEPNILYEQFGNLTKDILYWSTIGTSRFYSIALGVIEVFTAILLLINRTRILGLIIAVGIFINVILVNFGFDISVKTFSFILLIMTIFSLSPNIKSLLDFFIRNKQVQLEINEFYLLKEKPIKNGFKTFIIGLMFIKVLFPYLEDKNFNDDQFPRPFLHGGYQVTESNQKNEIFKIKRFYIHKNNYLILENSAGKRVDYYFVLNKSKKQLQLINYKSKTQLVEYIYSVNDSVLQLIFPDFKIIGKAQNWRKLPVLKNDFHYTIDQIK